MILWEINDFTAGFNVGEPETSRLLRAGHTLAMQLSCEASGEYPFLQVYLMLQVLDIITSVFFSRINTDLD